MDVKFIIENKTKSPKTILDFVSENPEVITNYRTRYNYTISEGFSLKKLLRSASFRNLTFSPGKNFCSFSEEDGDMLGLVFERTLEDIDLPSFNVKRLK